MKTKNPLITKFVMKTKAEKDVIAMYENAAREKEELIAEQKLVYFKHLSYLFHEFVKEFTEAFEGKPVNPPLSATVDETRINIGSNEFSSVYANIELVGNLIHFKLKSFKEAAAAGSWQFDVVPNRRVILADQPSEGKRRRTFSPEQLCNFVMEHILDLSDG